MQSFLRKVVTQHHLQRPNCHRISHTHIAFPSLPKPSQPYLQQGHNIFTSFLTHTFLPPHSCHSHHSLSAKILGSLSNSLIVRQFVSNSIVRNSTRRFLDCRLNNFSRVHFLRQSFDFDKSLDFNRRGLRSWFRRQTPNSMVLGLIIANVAVFLLWRIADQKFMIKNFTISLDNFKSGRFHTLITNAFSHIETGHILYNMIGLYFFGINIGRTFGPEFLLKLYLAGAVGGSVFYLLHQVYKAQTSKQSRGFLNPSREFALGASAAVNAVMLLDIFLNPKATLYLDFILPVPAILLGIFLIGKDMLRILEGDSHISGSAHLGGAAVAAIAWAGIRKGRF